MKRSGRSKFQIISNQKKQNRRSNSIHARSKVDLMELHKNIAVSGKRYKPSRFGWLGRILITLAASFVFFLAGYGIAALASPVWIKMVLFFSVAVAGFFISYIIISLFQ